MKKPNIIALPTSQMMVFCDILCIEVEDYDKAGMIKALEKADFSKLEKGVTHNFTPDVVEANIVAARVKELGRTQKKLSRKK